MNDSRHLHDPGTSLVRTILPVWLVTAAWDAVCSITRGFWGSVSILFLIIGAVGMVVVVERLGKGDPSRQFALPKWRRLRRGGTA